MTASRHPSPELLARYTAGSLSPAAALVVESREAGDEPALQAAAADLTAQGGRVLFARAEAYPCASSDIRSGKIPPEQWLEVLPPETLRVVRENHLYSAEKEV